MKKIIRKLLLVLLVAFTMVTLAVAPAAAAPLLDIETVSGLEATPTPPGSSIISMDMVKVGDAGNAVDPATDNKYGAVSYDYYIGTYEVTNSQYAAFLNAVAKTDTYSLYSKYMGSDADYGGITQNGSSGSYTYSVKPGWEDKPVNYVSFWDAARFVNWLSTGDTETGVYVLTSDGISNNSITRDADAWATADYYAIASENEWYKAAYYNGNEAGTYRTYPVTGDLSQTVANYNNNGYLMPGGTYIANVDYFDLVEGASSYYGTYQQGGNLQEWNDTVVSGNTRGTRGGSFDYPDVLLASSLRSYNTATVETNNFGFRVTASSLTVPEPGTYGILAGAAALLGAIALRRRPRRD